MCVRSILVVTLHKGIYTVLEKTRGSHFYVSFDEKLKGLLLRQW